MGDLDKELSDKYGPRFGYLAVEMGFSTPEQIKKALADQVEDNLANMPHRLMGRILLDNGWITHQQVELVLNKLFNSEKYK